MHFVSYSAFGRAIGAFALTRIHLPTPAQAPSVPAHHILLIDASGSMWGDMDQMQATHQNMFEVMMHGRGGLQSLPAARELQGTMPQSFSLIT